MLDFNISEWQILNSNNNYYNTIFV